MFSPLHLLVLLGLILAFPVLGVEPKTGDGGLAMKKAQGLIRQLSQDKTTLEAEKAVWQAEKTASLQEKAALETKLKMLLEAVRTLQPLLGEVERYKAGLESMKNAFDKQVDLDRQNQQVLVQKHNEMIGKANAIYADNQLLVQAVRERETWIEQCSTANHKLRAASVELLDKYRGRGLFQQLGELEPLTGLGQIETETTIEEYKYQLKQLQITPFKVTDNRLDSLMKTTNQPAANAEIQQNSVDDPQAESHDNTTATVDKAAENPALPP
jgi:hypothetical protein